MNADFEENFGLLSHAMDIYDIAAKECLSENLEIWNLYIGKATQYYGIVRTR